MFCSSVSHGKRAASWKISVGRPPNLTTGDDQVLLLSFPLNGLRFDAPGYYVVTLQLDGVEMTRAPFRVVLTQTPPATIQA